MEVPLVILCEECRKVNGENISKAYIEIARLNAELKAQKEMAYKFAVQITEMRDRLTVLDFIHKVSAPSVPSIPGSPLSANGEENVSTGQAMSEFQQADPL